MGGVMSRRGLFAAAAAAMAGVVSARFPVAAGGDPTDGDALIIGSSWNSSTQTTTLTTTASEGIYVRHSLHGTAARLQSFNGGIGLLSETDGGASVGVLTQGETGVSAGGSRVGVRGASDSGRGGVFSGGRAAMRLMPSSSASHPRRGLGGDLFLDRSRRLWFCRGGTDWVRLA
jgi:hypothetical protein